MKLTDLSVNLSNLVLILLTCVELIDTDVTLPDLTLDYFKMTDLKFDCFKLTDLTFDYFVLTNLVLN